MIRQHHRTATLAALVLALIAIVTPAASADPQPLAKAEAAMAAAEPSAGTPVVRPNPDEQDSGARPTSVTVHVTAPSAGFDWGDAGVGAGSILALTLIGLGGGLAVTRRRNHRVPPNARANPQGQPTHV